MAEARVHLFDKPPVSFTAATLAAVAPFLLRQYLEHHFGYQLPPFLFFFPGILLIALRFGFWAGVLTTVASGAIADLWIIDPPDQWRIIHIEDALSLSLFCLMGMFMSFVAERYRASLQRNAYLESDKELQEWKNRFQAVLCDSRDILYRLNLQTGRFEYISPSVEKILGYSPEDLMLLDYQNADELIHPDDREVLKKKIEKITAEGSGEVEYRQLDAWGRYHWISTVCSVVRDREGRPLYRTGSARDMTEKKKADEVLLRSATMASAGRLAGAIVHEINNPLAAVNNLLFLAQSCSDLPEQARAYLAQAGSELDRVVKITHNSLNFYREGGTVQPLQADEVLESSLTLLRTQILLRQASIRRDWRGPVQINGVRGDLRQIATNLIANSLDAIEVGGKVHLRLRKRKNPVSGQSELRILVADSGQGIPSDLRKHIFEPFFTTKKNTGTGLGLWITRQLVEKNGGRIHLRSVTTGPFRGSAFVVDLPDRTDSIR